MFGWLNKRIKFHKKSFRVLWIPIMFIWSLFSNAVTIRDNFFSTQWQQRLATLSILPKWNWYIWVIGTLVIIIIALIEGSYRAAQSEQPQDVFPEDTAGKKSNVIPASELPEHRPRVIPAGYGKEPERNAFGLFIVNPGYMALEVYVPTIAIAPSGYMLVIPEKLAQLGERDHKCFMEARLEHPVLPRLGGSQLSKVMRSANVSSLNFSIRYRDLDSLRYKSNCAIELDIASHSGIRVLFIGQERDMGEPLENPLPIISQLDRASANWLNTEWKELAARFEKLTKHVEAQLQTDHMHGQITEEEWRVSGYDDSRQACEALCRYAGTLLTKSPNISRKLSARAQNEINPAWRWLFFIKENCNATDIRDTTSLTNEQGYSVKSEVIREVPVVSARMCIDCAAQEL